LYNRRATGERQESFEEIKKYKTRGVPGQELLIATKSTTHIFTVARNQSFLGFQVDEKCSFLIKEMSFYEARKFQV
jgi:hypothetical protein